VVACVDRRKSSSSVRDWRKKKTLFERERTGEKEIKGEKVMKGERDERTERD
jgi:hypothetical protein